MQIETNNCSPSPQSNQYNLPPTRLYILNDTYQVNVEATIDCVGMLVSCNDTFQENDPPPEWWPNNHHLPRTIYHKTTLSSYVVALS